MIFRSADTRGHIVKSWKNEDNYESYRSFSCMSYQDPSYTNWGPVVTINDDRTRPGFETTYHEHKGLDILNYMIEGECRHVDNLGNDNVASAGDIQHFWCGPSIWHTLSNESKLPARYLQIWIQPNLLCVDPPAYQFIKRPREFSEVPIKFKNTRFSMSAGFLTEPLVTEWAYLFVAEGSCKANGVELSEGDAIEINAECLIEGDGHVILFELS